MNCEECGETAERMVVIDNHPMCKSCATSLSQIDWPNAAWRERGASRSASPERDRHSGKLISPGS
jgi:hypothetical protein